MMGHIFRRKKVSRGCRFLAIVMSVAMFVFISNMTLLDPIFTQTAPPVDEEAKWKISPGLTHQVLQARKLEGYKPNETDDFVKNDAFHTTQGLTAIEEVKNVVYKENFLQVFGHMWKVPTRGVIRRLSDGFITSSGSIYDNETIHDFKQGIRRSLDNRIKPDVNQSFSEILSLLDIKQETFEDFVFGILPLLNVSCDFITSTASLRVLIKSQLSSELLMYFCDLGDRKIVQPGADVIFRAKNVYHASFLPSYVPYTQGFIPPNSLEQLPGRTTVISTDIILYLREVDGALLTIANENEILGAIRAALPEPFTLTTVTASQKEWQKNKEFFSQAFIVIAPHSSSLSNVVFCQPGTHVVEIVPPNFNCRRFPAKCYVGLSKSFGLNHWILPSVVNRDKHNVATVPSDNILETLSVILDDMGTDENFQMLQRFFHEDMIFTLGQSSAIVNDILFRPIGTKLLVFGASEDIILWQRANGNGQTTLVTDGSLADQFKSLPNVTTILAHCLTDQAKWKYYLNNVTALAEEFPNDLKGTVWDIIIIIGSAATRTFPAKSGSMKPIYWASQMIKPGTTVYVHNAQTIVEGAFSVTYLGQSVLWLDALSGALAKYEPFEI